MTPEELAELATDMTMDSGDADRRMLLRGVPLADYEQEGEPMSDLVDDLYPRPEIPVRAETTPPAMCKIDGCENEVAMVRGKYAYLCVTHRKQKVEADRTIKAKTRTPGVARVKSDPPAEAKPPQTAVLEQLHAALDELGGLEARGHFLRAEIVKLANQL